MTPKLLHRVKSLDHHGVQLVNPAGNDHVRPPLLQETAGHRQGSLRRTEALDDGHIRPLDAMFDRGVAGSGIPTRRRRAETPGDARAGSARATRGAPGGTPLPARSGNSPWQGYSSADSFHSPRSTRTSLKTLRPSTTTGIPPYVTIWKMTSATSWRVAPTLRAAWMWARSSGSRFSAVRAATAHSSRSRWLS